MTFDVSIGIIAVAWLSISVLVIAICAAAGRAERIAARESSASRPRPRRGHVGQRFLARFDASAVKQSQRISPIR